jgi:glycine reductase
MRVVHFINQFFAGFGGEEQADTPYGVFDGARGPAIALQQALPEGVAVVATLYCGDNYASEHSETFLQNAIKTLEELKPDVIVAGPSFNAGRYGLSCGMLLKAARASCGIPGVAGMSPDNPAVEAYRKECCIIPVGSTAASLSRSMPKLAALACKLGAKIPLGSAEEEGYMPRGIRLNKRVGQSAATRAVETLLARVHGKSWENEVPLLRYEQIAPPPPVANMRSATIALVTEGGIVPVGNPDRLETRSCSKWRAYPLEGKDLPQGKYEAWHGGYVTSWVAQDPDRNLPYDALSDCAREKIIGKVFENYCVTTGNASTVSTMSKLGREIGEYLKGNGVSGVILTAT